MHLQALLCGHHVAQPSTSMGILKERGKQWHRAHEAKYTPPDPTFPSL